MPGLNPESTAHAYGNTFPTTHWSVVLTAKERELPEAEAALETLCRTYWAPVYAFIRRWGYDSASAEDLTQSFFSDLLTKDYLGHLRHREGKFRSFLLTFLKHFLSSERAKATAQKRGGGKVFVSLDGCSEEERRLVEAVPDLTAEQVFDRRWAQAVMEASLHRLRDEYVARGKGELFERLKDLQPGERGESSYSEFGASLRMSEDAIKTAVHRLRRRQAEILREEIVRTAVRSEEIEEEIRYFMTVLRP
jgi:DNA-directed RNA polymerase specialized sigma24 family protein